MEGLSEGYAGAAVASKLAWQEVASKLRHCGVKFCNCSSVSKMAANSQRPPVLLNP
jgi:hypothetical protein